MGTAQWGWAVEVFSFGLAYLVGMKTIYRLDELPATGRSMVKQPLLYNCKRYYAKNA